MDLSSSSYIGIIICLILTGCGLPIPEEVFIIGAGISAAHNVLDPALAFASCMIGAIVGDCIMYGIGRRFGRRLLTKKGWFSLKPERERQIEKMIDKHGLKVFFLARFLVGVRGPMYITVGILRVPLRQFLVIDSICALAVISTFFGLSYMFGINMKKWFPWIHAQQLKVTIVLAVAAAIAALVYWLYFHRRAQAAFEDKSEEEPNPGEASSDAANEDDDVLNKSNTPA